MSISGSSVAVRTGSCSFSDCLPNLISNLDPLVAIRITVTAEIEVAVLQTTEIVFVVIVDQGSSCLVSWEVGCIIEVGSLDWSSDESTSVQAGHQRSVEYLHPNS